MTIVTLTSFPARMSFVPKVLDSIYSQTQQPDAVVLHLSLEEYPQHEGSLPSDVLQYTYNKGMMLRWHDGNERCWKKLIPTMREWPDAEIISIDDDIIYPLHFVETITREFRENGCSQPITCGHVPWKNWGGIYSHYGCFSLTQAKFHAPYVFELYDRYIRKVVLENSVKTFDDELYTLTALCNGIFYKASSMNLNPLRKEHQLPCPVSHTANWKQDWHRWRDHLHDLILKQYGIDARQCAFAPNIQPSILNVQ